MGERRRVGAHDARGGEQRLVQRVDLRPLEGIGRVVHLSASQAAVAHRGVEEIPLGEEVLQRARLGGLGRPDGAVRHGAARGQRRRRAARGAVRHGAVRGVLHRHLRVMIRQLPHRPRHLNGQPRRGVEGEKPHPGRGPFVVHVGAHVGLQEVVGARHRGRPLRRTPFIAKGTSPTHALPSKVSISSAAGIFGRSISTGTRQWRKSSDSQVWYWATRCPVGRRVGAMRSMASAVIGANDTRSPAPRDTPSPAPREIVCPSDTIADETYRFSMRTGGVRLCVRD